MTVSVSVLTGSRGPDSGLSSVCSTGSDGVNAGPMGPSGAYIYWQVGEDPLPVLRAALREVGKMLDRELVLTARRQRPGRAG